jgi:DNA repair photolyase
MIYEPKGRAREYSPLACNIAVGCVHDCKYPCYGPGAFRVNPVDWPKPRYKKDAVLSFEKDARKLAGDPRDILFCFASDPYMTDESSRLMSEILPIAEANRLRIQVLTKNPARAMRESGHILKRNGWKLGTTIIFLSEKLREKWEPGAPSIASRLEALRDAHEAGISTWVSIEPVVDADEAVAAIEAVKPFTDFIKVGKLNHSKHADSIDWFDFLSRAKEALGDHPHLIKDDLKKFAR